jgi:hypothetical protein
MLDSTMVHQSFSSALTPLEIFSDPNGQNLNFSLSDPLWNVALDMTVP